MWNEECTKTARS